MSKQSQFEKVQIMGVDIDAATIQSATRYICERAAVPSSRSFYVTKPYSEFLDRLRAEPALRPYLNDAELCLPDGIALCWASVYLYGGSHHWWRVVTTGAKLVFKPSSAYKFLPEKFAGTNATVALLKAATDHHLRVFLIGSPRHNNMNRTIQAILEQLPELKIVGSAPGEIGGKYGPELASALMNDLSVSELAQRITETQADLILVGIGFPQQEILMSRLIAEVQHGAFIGEGGTFDYRLFGGKQPRAPQWIQTIGVEWLWRLITDPRRIKRQLAIPRFIYHIWHSR